MQSFRMMPRKQDYDVFICNDMHLTFNNESSLWIKGENKKKKKDSHTMNPCGRKAQKTNFNLHCPPVNESEDL